ncbi:hypothetical protein FDP41_002123 [Naegleria fowleri]|uniref:acid phosphatase n=1 Tax=Naegleria fowleri TaxID=5763 RepID=A0A6A5BLZ7_NAEFO|nr:uncharacterized protein FDP41_002123 [Naegleria fowleri]KAF0979053.1 hypothetical protein FDP41_002123 [Naegleria fowleri]
MLSRAFYDDPHQLSGKASKVLSVLCVATVMIGCIIFVGLITVQTLYLSKRVRQSGIIFPNPPYSKNDDCLHFLVIGDFGRGNDMQKQIAKVMGDYCQENNGCDFVIGTGDNIYPDGVTSVNDEQFKTKFEDIYTHPSLNNIDFYLVLGNHDYRSNPQAEIEYTKLSKKWKILDYFYELKKKSRLGGFELSLVFTDTNPFHKLFFWDPYINSTALNEQKKRIPDQLNWLKQTLTSHEPRGESTWSIVVGHSPVYSSSAHYDSQPLIDNFEPLFKEYQVPLYLCGHDHYLGWLANRLITNEKEKTQYVVSGAAGGQIYERMKYNANLLNYYIGPGGFFSVEVQKEFIFVRALDENGKEVFKFRIDK